MTETPKSDKTAAANAHTTSVVDLKFKVGR
jgi:hypothetical protein